jgi:hypothetical protein
VGGVVDRLRDGVEEAPVGVRREVDDNRGPGRNRAGDLDVKHHLAIGTVRRCWIVAAAIDRDGRDGRPGNAERLEIEVEVGRPEPAAQLDQGDRFARSVDARDEVIEKSNLGRREALFDDLGRPKRAGRPGGRIASPIA